MSAMGRKQTLALQMNERQLAGLARMRGNGWDGRLAATALMSGMGRKLPLVLAITAFATAIIIAVTTVFISGLVDV
jgi:hypothetical protein